MFGLLCLSIGSVWSFVFNILFILLIFYGGEVYMNSVFEKGVEGLDYGYDYDSIISVFFMGLRRKVNGFYELMMLILLLFLLLWYLKYKKVNEVIFYCLSCSFMFLLKGFLYKKGGFCVNKLVVFFMFVIFVVLVVVLLFVVFMILGIYGFKCECV